MTPHPGLSRLLFWLAAPLGLASLGFAVFFGIDVWRIWIRPARIVEAPETMEQGLGVMLNIAGNVSDGITKQIFATSLIALAAAAGLLLLSRKLRGPI